MVQNIITDLCHHLEIGIDGNLDIGNKRVIVGTPTITLTNNILTIICDTVGANIYYTLDGSTPTSSSTKYTSAVTLNNSCTIKAIAIKGNKSSIVVSQDYIAILSAWKIVGNSEVHGTEIWSCGEYNPTDGKYHILVQPLGGSIADIALDEPLRKVNDVADTIEFEDGVAVVTRNIKYRTSLAAYSWQTSITSQSGKLRWYTWNAVQQDKCLPPAQSTDIANVLTPIATTGTFQNIQQCIDGTISMSTAGALTIYFDDYNEATDENALLAFLANKPIIFITSVPTTETIQVPQIAEADSYTCVISQGAKAIGWSSFTPNPS